MRAWPSVVVCDYMGRADGNEYGYRVGGGAMWPIETGGKLLPQPGWGCPGRARLKEQARFGWGLGGNCECSPLHGYITNTQGQVINFQCTIEREQKCLPGPRREFSARRDSPTVMSLAICLPGQPAFVVMCQNLCPLPPYVPLSLMSSTRPASTRPSIRASLLYSLVHVR